MNRPPASLPAWPLLLPLLALAPGCFSEPEPVADSGDDTVVMCIQAPCTATEGVSTTELTTSGDSESTASPDDSTGPGPSTGPSSSDGLDDSTGTASSCGDGVLNHPTEMCDSTPGCLEDCTFADYTCNPLNDAVCVGGLRCGAIDVPSETFGCMPAGAGAVGTACTGVPSNDSDCGVGLTCLFNLNTPLCNVGNCCVEYCDLTDAMVGCSGGATCRPFFVGPMYQGLEHLGFCGNP